MVSVKIKPGAIALTRMPSAANSRASWAVAPRTASYDTPYAARLA
jgi:hypothetical protein